MNLPPPPRRHRSGDGVVHGSNGTSSNDTGVNGIGSNGTGSNGTVASAAGGLPREDCCPPVADVSALRGRQWSLAETRHTLRCVAAMSESGRVHGLAALEREVDGDGVAGHSLTELWAALRNVTHDFGAVGEADVEFVLHKCTK